MDVLRQKGEMEIAQVGTGDAADCGGTWADDRFFHTTEVNLVTRLLGKGAGWAPLSLPDRGAS